MLLGNKISDLRKQKGLSQEQLGERVDVTRQTISNWELGETTPNIEQIKLLSKVLNISIDELLDNDVKSVLVKRVSNTERLAGIIIKSLKFIGIGFIVLLVIDLISLILFVSTGKLKKTGSSATTVCEIGDKSYQIEFGTNQDFDCDNCSLKMEKELKKLVSSNNISKSMINIEEYFISNNGSCK